MPKKSNETTTKFKVDISELKKGIQEANRQIRLANAEFKAASSGMDDWGKSTDGISAKIKQLETVLLNENKKLASLKEQLKLVEKEQGANSKGAEELRISIANQQATVNKVEKSLNDHKTKLIELENEQKNAGKAADEQKTSYSQLSDKIAEQQDELESLKNKYAGIVLEQGKSSKEAKSLAKEIKLLSKELNSNADELKKADDAADNLTSELKDIDNAAEKTENGFTILKATLANLASEGIKKVVDGLKELGTQLLTDGTNAYAQFAAATGTAADAMDAYKTAIENVYKDNFGESLEDVATKMAKVKEVTKEIDASKLEDMTKKVITLEEVFDMDIVETLRGVNALTEHFGVSGETALDLIAYGAQKGLNYTDELGDNISEYAGKFNEAGYSVTEYFQLLKNGVEGGAYNLDKVNDAINEVTTRLADGTIADGLGSFSESTKNVFEAWKKGEATQKEVINSIVKDIQDTTNEQEKMNKAALAFGTMAEDGGTKFIESLTPVGNTFDDVKGKAEELANVKYDTPAAELSGVGRTLKVDLMQPLIEKMLPTIEKISDWCVENVPDIVEKVQDIVTKTKEAINVIDKISPALASLGVALAGLALAGVISNVNGVATAMAKAVMSTKLMTAAQWLLNVAMSANPITLVVIAIASLTTGFVLLWKKSEKFRNFWIGLWEGLKNTVNIVVEWIKKNWKTMLLFLVNPLAGIFKLCYDHFDGFREKVDNVVKSVKDFFTELWDSTKEVITKIKDFFTNTWNSIADAISTVWEKIKEIFSPAAKWFSELFSSLWATVTSIVNVIIGLAKGTVIAVQTIWGIVKDWFNEHVIQPVKEFFVNLWNDISNAASTAWETIKTVFDVVTTWFDEHVIQPVSKFFSGMWDKLKTGASDAWQGVKDVFSKVGDFFSETFSAAWTKVKDIFSTGGKIFDGIKEGIADTFKTIVNKLIGGINTIVAMPFNAINGMLNKIRDVGIGNVKPFSGMWDKNPISIPEIPELWRGGVLEKGQKGYLEGKGAEAVIPLENNKKWISKTARDLKESLNNEGLFGKNVAQTKTIENHYNFEQNITSPKSLSRLEIYRQTRNQLNFAKGV